MTEENAEIRGGRRSVFHLPGLDPGPRMSSGWFEGATPAGLRFRAPNLTSEGASRAADRVSEAAALAQRHRTLAQVVSAAAEAAGRLVDPTSCAGSEALQVLREELAWPESVARETLLGMGRIWTEQALWEVIRSELPDPAVLEGFSPSSESRARRASGPRLLLQVVSANVPGVAVTGVIRALLCRSGVLVKLPEDGPGLVVLFARLLAEADPVLGDAVAATWWPSALECPLWQTWVARASRIVVYGGKAAVEGVRGRARTDQDVLAYGPKLGVAVVLPDMDLAPAARGLARDICAYEQQGCVSPRLIFTLGPPAELAQELAPALSGEVARLGLPPLRPEEAVAIRSLRAEVEFRGYGGSASRVVASGEDLAWTILIDDPPSLESVSLPRVVRLSHIGSVEALRESLRPLEGRIQVLGYAGGGGQLALLAEAAADLRVSRITPVGRMAWPPADWRHDGRFQLLPLLDWTEWEVE